jgi:hypothetical protein
MTDKPYDQTTDALRDAIVERDGAVRDRCEVAIEIIRQTRDGDDLAPEHLYLVQMAVNGQLNANGEAAFAKLYDEVMAGAYRKPWLGGVEHLTRDHEGYVYWNGVHVEHYNAGYASTPEGKAECEELGRRCRYLESIGVQPDAAECIWWWDERYEESSRRQESK